jgi:hypothetical protein
MGALGLLSAESAVVGEWKRCITALAATQDCTSDGNEDSDEETIADDDQEPPRAHWDRQATNYCDFWSERAAAAAACGLSPGEKRSDDVPAMPFIGDPGGPLPPIGLASHLERHRPKIAPRRVPFNALVARPVHKVEIARTPAAQAAMDSEWKRLIDKVWDVDSVREWCDVAAEASRKKKEVQLGYLFGICVEKNAELPADHPSRKFKGRVVFHGNRVVNQNWEAAVFQDMGKSPATMDASRACDCYYGSMPGNKTEIADAEQAYIQADLKGNDC